MLSIRASGIENAKKSISEKVRKKHISIMFYLDRRLVASTPEDTGRAKSNWIASINVPSRQKLNTEKLTKKTKRKGMYKKNNNTGPISSIQPYSISYMSNNMPYILRLNNGHSKKRKEIDWIGRIVKEAAKKAVI